MIEKTCLILKHFYELQCTDTKNEIEKSIKKAKLKIYPSISFETNCLVFYCFDLALAKGPETNLRNNLRDGFLSTLNLDSANIIKMQSRIMEYQSAYKSGRDDISRSMSFGNVFAKNINHPDNPQVSLLAYSFFLGNLEFADKSINPMIKDLLNYLNS
jgi:hypothetical protein